MSDDYGNAAGYYEPPGGDPPIPLGRLTIIGMLSDHGFRQATAGGTAGFRVDQIDPGTFRVRHTPETGSRAEVTIAAMAAPLREAGWQAQIEDGPYPHLVLTQAPPGPPRLAGDPLGGSRISPEEATGLMLSWAAASLEYAQTLDGWPGFSRWIATQPDAAPLTRTQLHMAEMTITVLAARCFGSGDLLSDVLSDPAPAGPPGLSRVAVIAVLACHGFQQARPDREGYIADTGPGGRLRVQYQAPAGTTAAASVAAMAEPLRKSGWTVAVRAEPVPHLLITEGE
jgi:hypothetical protein